MSTKSKDDRSSMLAGLMARKPTSVVPAIAEKDRVKPTSINSMGTSIRELGALAVAAQQAEATGGIIELDPSNLDSSLVRDRLDAVVDPDFDALVASIGASGQQVPILVRKHPTSPGRYQIAYGHRRARAAAKLGLKVKAILRALTDAELVVAQGNENNERRDLSFIERAVFARRLEEAGFDRATIMAALSTDKGDLSRYISIAQEFDQKLLEAIGPAPKVGRARWQALALHMKKEVSRALAEAVVSSQWYQPLDSNARFARVLQAVTAPTPVEATVTFGQPTLEQSVSVKRKADRTIIVVDEVRSPEFGSFLCARLEDLYAEFLRGAQVTQRSETKFEEKADAVA